MEFVLAALLSLRLRLKATLYAANLPDELRLTELITIWGDAVCQPKVRYRGFLAAVKDRKPQPVEATPGRRRGGPCLAGLSARMFPMGPRGLPGTGRCRHACREVHPEQQGQ